MEEPSLYERLGGAYAISAVVDHFSDQLVEKGTIEEQNPQIKDWNENEAGARLPGLRFLRTLWVCAIAGGPFEYTGLPLDDAHAELRLSPPEFDQVAAVLADSLDHFNVPALEKEEVPGRLRGPQAAGHGWFDLTKLDPHPGADPGAGLALGL